MTTRAEVVAAARSLLETPYVTHQRQAGVGVDCIGLPILVARMCGFVAPDFDINGYPMQPNGEMVPLLDRYLLRVPQARMQAGDVLTVSWGDHRAHHVGIVAPHSAYPGRLSLIHAYPKQGRVVEHRLAFDNFMRFVAAHQFPGVA